MSFSFEVQATGKIYIQTSNVEDLPIVISAWLKTNRKGLLQVENVDTVFQRQGINTEITFSKVSIENVIRDTVHVFINKDKEGVTIQIVGNLVIKDNILVSKVTVFFYRAEMKVI